MKLADIEESTTEPDVDKSSLPTITSNSGPILRLEASKGWTSLKLGDLWEFRDLVYFFVWRDVKIRYKQTFLGVAWAIIQPVFTMLIFTLFFGRLGKMPSDGIPYSLFSLTALVPWTFFAGGLTNSANSLVGSANLIRKIYFPRLILPISSILAGTVDFALSFVILLAMMFWHKISITPQVIWLVPLFVLALVTCLGAGLWLAALNVQFRDVRHTLPFLVQLWLFATPIAYPASLVPDKWRGIYALNPMVGVIEGFRWVLLGTKVPPGTLLLFSVPVAMGLLISGMLYFRRVERSFADVV